MLARCWPPPRWSNSEESGSSWLIGNEELSSKKWCWLFPVTEDSGVADSKGCDWKKGWSVVGGRSKGCPWVCSVQTLLKQKTDPRDLGAHCPKPFFNSTFQREFHWPFIKGFW